MDQSQVRLDHKTVRDGIAYYFLLMMARRLPMLLLVLGGSALAIIRWQRHPRVSLLTLLALMIYFVEAMLFILFLYWLPELITSIGISGIFTSWIYSIVFFFEDFVFALVIILLVGAAFTKRAPRVAMEDL
jgi:hypothetical protein